MITVPSQLCFDAASLNLHASSGLTAAFALSLGDILKMVPWISHNGCDAGIRLSRFLSWIHIQFISCWFDAFNYHCRPWVEVFIYKKNYISSVVYWSCSDLQPLKVSVMDVELVLCWFDICCTVIAGLWNQCVNIVLFEGISQQCSNLLLCVMNKLVVVHSGNQNLIQSGMWIQKNLVKQKTWFLEENIFWQDISW